MLWVRKEAIGEAAAFAKKNSFVPRRHHFSSITNVTNCTEIVLLQ